MRITQETNRTVIIATNSGEDCYADQFSTSDPDPIPSEQISLGRNIAILGATAPPKGIFGWSTILLGEAACYHILACRIASYVIPAFDKEEQQFIETRLALGGHAFHQGAPIKERRVTESRGPLSGLRIIELGHFVAAPFAARILADLGAEVIKIEPPSSGDPARSWGALRDGRSIWWSVHARNKKSVGLDLKTVEGRDILLGLITKSDAVIENFRPGQLERWGLGPEVFKRTNPNCIVVRISGFGQSGPYRDKPAFGLIGEALGGIRYLTGYPQESHLPPIRVGISLGDSVAGLYAVIGVLAAVYARRSGIPPSLPVDVALYESVFSLLEGALPEYGLLGIVRQPAGSTLPTAAPSNSYRARDGEWICIGGNSDRIFERLAQRIGRPECASDPRFATNDLRVAHMSELDELISDWVSRYPAQEAEALLEDADVPVCRIYSIADCAKDPHFVARGMVRTVDDPAFGATLHPGIVPRFEEFVDAPLKAGPDLGSDTDSVLSSIVGYGSERIAELRARGIIK